MGILTIMVLPQPLRSPIRLHLHPRKRKRFVLSPPLTTPKQLILDRGLAASQMASQMSQMNPGAAGTGMFQPGQDPDKVFQSEAENLEVMEHEYILQGVEDRLLASI